MRNLPGGLSDGAWLKKVSDAPWKPSNLKANLPAAKSLRAWPMLYWGELGEYTPAAHRSCAVLIASRKPSISTNEVSLPLASTLHMFGRPNMAGKKPLVRP